MYYRKFLVRVTLKPVLKDHPTGDTNMVSHDRWCLVGSSFTLKCRTFCQKLVVLQDRWSLMVEVSQDRVPYTRMCMNIQIHVRPVLPVNYRYCKFFNVRGD